MDRKSPSRILLTVVVKAFFYCCFVNLQKKVLRNRCKKVKGFLKSPTISYKIKA